MAKRKTRAARKQTRQKAVRAETRGLPSAQVENREQAAARALEKTKGRARTGRGRLSDPSARNAGKPTFIKVLVGAFVALLLVYALSEWRKGQSPPASDPEASPGAGTEVSSAAQGLLGETLTAEASTLS